MIVGVPKETSPGEARVALVPASIAALKKANLEVILESGAGTRAGFADADYEKNGARVVHDRREVFATSDIVLQVRGLGANPEQGRDDLDFYKQGQVVIAIQEPLTARAEMEELARRGVSAFALELIPRITRAQAMDILSSQANLAGYKAVLIAAETVHKIFPMMMTAAGTITPAKVFIIGAGVAGLQAIATAKRLGAVVSAYDVRPEVKEQVQSLGAKFVELPLETTTGEGGYAKAMDENFYTRQREMMMRVLRESDVVITTAAVPGKKAPTLITREMVEQMAPGSVVVDLAAERGGNCELTQPGHHTEHNGVVIIGPLNLPSRVGNHASQLLAKNITTFLLHLMKDGALRLDMDDEITRETLVTRGGEIVNSRVRHALGLGELLRGADVIETAGAPASA